MTFELKILIVVFILLLVWGIVSCIYIRKESKKQKTFFNPLLINSFFHFFGFLIIFISFIYLILVLIHWGAKLVCYIFKIEI